MTVCIFWRWDSNDDLKFGFVLIRNMVKYFKNNMGYHPYRNIEKELGRFSLKLWIEVLLRLSWIVLFFLYLVL